MKHGPPRPAGAHNSVALDTRNSVAGKGKRKRRKRTTAASLERKIRARARVRQAAWTETGRPDVTVPITIELNGKPHKDNDGLFADLRAARAKGSSR